jgi:phage gp36-like protein
VDDDPTTQTDVLESAAVEVNGYLQLNYDPDQLAASNWVRFKTRDVAVYLLCLRRNMPPPQSVQARYDKAIEDLEKVQAGGMRVPDVAERKANVPVLSNQRVTLTPFPRVVNVPGKSTGKPENYPAASTTPPTTSTTRSDHSPTTLERLPTMRGAKPITNGRRPVDLLDEAFDQPPSGGLVGEAQAALAALAGCRLAAGGLRAAILPPEPAACGEAKDCAPRDMASLLAAIRDEVGVLQKELNELANAVQG